MTNSEPSGAPVSASGIASCSDNASGCQLRKESLRGIGLTCRTNFIKTMFVVVFSIYTRAIHNACLNFFNQSMSYAKCDHDNA